MGTQLSRRLPGIRFEVQAPPLTDVLPRMDVAVFVGFAASGPLHIPVAVEDVAHFTAIFGDDLPIAWYPQGGEIVYGYLASAVRAFFRNGGQRCWIIRVGNASYNTFVVPHLGQVQQNQQTNKWEVVTTLAMASSPGSWSDALRINTALLSEATTIDAATFNQDNTITLSLTSDFDIVEGGMLQVTYTDGTNPQYVLYVVLENVQVTHAKTVGNSSQQFSAIANTFFLFRAAAPNPAILINPLVLVEPPVLVTPIPAADKLGTVDTHATMLSFELWVKYEDGSQAHLSDLGFSKKHPRFWGALPTDEQAYVNTGIPTINPYAALWQEALQQHFPFAKESAEDVFYLPINMKVIPDDTEFQGAQPRADITLSGTTSGTRPETPLDRDGLSIFDEKLFLDPALQDASIENLLAQADYISNQSTPPNPLHGIHAALYIDEATLIAVPDAIHLGWTSIYDAGDPPAPTPPTTPIAPPPAVPPPPFQNCAIVPIPPAPVLTQPQSKIQPSNFTLTWTAVGATGQTVRYTLQEATYPDFADAVTVYVGSIIRKDASISWTLYGRGPRDYYYRVNAEINGVASDWSNGVVIRIAPGVQWQLNESAAYNERLLLTIHSALLRLCGARGDIFAVMTLPAHYREDDAITYTTHIKPTLKQFNATGEIDVNILGYDEARAFSFGALYHPWLIGRENNQLDELRQTPPDGAATGIMARRALTRGAWIAPANEVLSNVVALTPALARERWLDLQNAQLNIVRQEPRGFLYLNADTLSDDDELRPINVRRLLILLRRLALRLGADYVFEPNNDAFRRAVQRGFEALLEQLFVRGAFAGNIASEGFQVVTKSYLNTPQSIEQGRFIVELKIAPSQPLTFLTVRLLQSHDNSLVTEE